MKALLNPRPGDFLLVVAPRAGGPMMSELMARLARGGPLRVLDGGNRFRAHELARALRRQVSDLHAALARVQLARAFTCYQMETLLKETPPLPLPTLVLDMLSTFYDESVPEWESQRLLESCLGALKGLNRLAPVAVSVRPGPPGHTSGYPGSAAERQEALFHGRLATVDRPQLLETLRAAADQVWSLEPHVPPPQPRLF